MDSDFGTWTGPNITTVPIHRVNGAAITERQDVLAVEEPLEIRVDTRNVSITMRTPGNDEELAAGFLFTEGILREHSQIAGIEITGENQVTVRLADNAEVDLGRLERHFYMSSSCGVCGKTSIGALETAGCRELTSGRPTVSPDLVHRLPELLRASQDVFDRTGGIHASALFHTSGRLLAVREDVGRHNALDKLIGAQFLTGNLPLDDHLILLSGRASFELVQKALMAGVAVLVAVGAPSSLAVEMAQRFNLTLIGFARDRKFNIYCGEARLK